ncbi:uncharacterized methyltransferase C3H7.11-like isoform X2 [Ananas comosus]|uniref:Uncharacterized methyltransferase C3H7.11-like isoform X2 n=1 Tax=Ananas comosus TaxID=4615 RepID=A0A6P5FSR9_ANACO|nr:uncharacterized methyltransferase C3H7.11-like isoform X2 [Ananas comosus]
MQRMPTSWIFFIFPLIKQIISYNYRNTLIERISLPRRLRPGEYNHIQNPRMAAPSLLLHRHCFHHLSRPSLCPSCVILRRRSLLRSYSTRSSPNRTSVEPKLHKYEINPRNYWDDFYKRHHNKFFKDRHYLEKDWGSYFSCHSGNEEPCLDPKVVLEVGCGAGNTLSPLLNAFPDIFVHACDFSPHAVELLKEQGTFKSDRMNAFVCDVTVDDLCNKIEPASVDIVTMIFMLSAVPPVKMPLVLQNIINVLKPGGFLLFRDYAMGDFAQEKLADKDQIISENFCVRGDGIGAYYFSEGFLSGLFERNGFKKIEVSVYHKQIVNHLRNVVMNRCRVSTLELWKSRRQEEYGIRAR